jgi:hypothetical protein
MGDRRQGQQRTERGGTTSSRTIAAQSLVAAACPRCKNPGGMEHLVAQRCSHPFSEEGSAIYEVVWVVSHKNIGSWCHI